MSETTTGPTAILDGPLIARILFPYAAQRTQDVLETGCRFVYYTSAETAMSIIKNRQLWLRSTKTMNDYMEIEHGLGCLQTTHEAEPGQLLDRALDECFPGLAAELWQTFEHLVPHIRNETYMICVSEHLPHENEHGRLSMWRAYGGQAGVAIVVKGNVMVRDSEDYGVYGSPVAYLTREAFADELAKIAKDVAINADYIRSLARDDVKRYAINMLRFATLCTKHPGFSEEREWRVLAMPSIFRTPLVSSSIECVRGIPQSVLKINLMNHPGLTGLALPELLDRIIIGPCEFPSVLHKAFWQLLTEAGISAPESKIIVSDIPLRHLKA
jgi:hypothetical protein